MQKYLVTNKARCKKCDTVIESKHRHDFRTCPCGNLSVDGGLDYVKRGWMKGSQEQAYEELSTYDDGTPYNP